MMGRESMRASEAILTPAAKNAKMWVSLTPIGVEHGPQEHLSLDAQPLQRGGGLGDGAARRHQQPVGFRVP